MIEAKTKNGNVETIVKGNLGEIIAELMYMNAAFINTLRKKGVKEQDIEKQLFNCVIAGFKIEDARKE
jgi:hypothetical protein